MKIFIGSILVLGSFIFLWRGIEWAKEKTGDSISSRSDRILSTIWNFITFAWMFGFGLLIIIVEVANQ